MKPIAPQYVKAYVRGQKNDTNDARAIAEAVRAPQMRFVAVKTVEQQDLQARGDASRRNVSVGSVSTVQWCDTADAGRISAQ